jgi:heptosyltransferase-2
VLTPLQRILIVRTDRLGDVILTLPLVSALRRAYPRAHIAFLLRRYAGGIVEGHPDVDETLWYDDPDGVPIPSGKMLRQIRSGQYQAAIVVYPRFRLAWMMFLAGIRIRLGSGFRFYSVLFNMRVFEHRKTARRHELEYNLNLLRPLGIDPGIGERPVAFGITVDPQAADRVTALLGGRGISTGSRYAILHPGSGKSAREWPQENFTELGRRIVAGRHTPVVVTGSEAERGITASLASAIGEGAHDCGGVFTLKELTAVCARGAVWVGHSTGPLHLSAAVGTPVVGLYPQLVPMSAARWGPISTRSRVHQPDRPADCRECAETGGGVCACMRTIRVEDVYRSVCELLDEGEKRG